ncbi:MAG: CCA tRNA nucleotidyltransferase [Alphaproteobacteria bacterium]
MRDRPARAVVAALTARGAEVRFVGGCVRDAYLGRPVKDVDLASPDPPTTVMELLEAVGIRTVPIGIAHGTVTAVVEGRPFEITTLRLDVETDGRHAVVAFTDDWAEDARRRDFTINSLSCAPDGTLYDPVGGLADLEAGRVRFVGDPAERIREDYLRVLRFFRFQAHYGRTPPDGAGLEACRAGAPGLTRLSGERVRDELFKLLAAPEPAGAVELMRDAGVLKAILPEAGPSDRLAALAGLEERPDSLRRLSALITRDAEEVGQRLRLSRAESERLKALVDPSVAIATDMTERARRRALYRVGATRFQDLVFHAWTEALMRRPEDETRLAKAYRQMLAAAKRWRPPVLPVKGADVVALGVKPGPAVGRLLAEVEAWWEDGDYKATRRDCLEKLKDLVAEVN